MGSNCEAESKTLHGISVRVLMADHFAKLHLEARALKVTQSHVEWGILFFLNDFSCGCDGKTS